MTPMPRRSPACLMSAAFFTPNGHNAISHRHERWYPGRWARQHRAGEGDHVAAGCIRKCDGVGIGKIGTSKERPDGARSRRIARFGRPRSRTRCSSRRAQLGRSASAMMGLPSSRTLCGTFAHLAGALDAHGGTCAARANDVPSAAPSSRRFALFDYIKASFQPL